MTRPAYVRLYETIRKEILAGRFPYRSKLPGKRIIADHYGISVITVAHAMALLVEEGYISARERSGCFVVYKSADNYQGTGLSDAAGFATLDQPSSVDVDGFPFPALARTMRRVLAEQAENILQKSPNQGLFCLRQALSNYLARSRGIFAEPEQIIVGAGAEYLYGQIVEMLGKNRIWAIESPSYEKIEQVYTAREISLDSLPLGRDGIVSDSLWHTSASVLHISPYRSYPSDVTASASKRTEYLQWGNQENHYLIEDDFESEFSVQHKPMDTLFSLSNNGNVIYLNTFSRTLSPAFRVGYMVLAPVLLPLYQDRAGFYSCTVPAYEQYVLAELINSGDFERHIRRVRRKIRAVSSP